MRKTLLVFLVALMGFWGAIGARAATGTPQRVSSAFAGAQADGRSQYPSISADGRYVAFVSIATNLVLGDTNIAWDVFVHDRQTDSTERVSVASGGAQGNSGSFYPSISADGRYVAFDSDATNLVPGDANSSRDVFVRDRTAGTTELVSVASDGTQGNRGSWYPSISADGRYVAFVSTATNLVAGDTNPGVYKIVVHDRTADTTELVSVASDGTQGDGWSFAPSISADGRYVAFQSDAANLVSGDTNNGGDVFVHDRQGHTTERVSVASDGSEASDTSWKALPSISADGRYVAFASFASDLVPGDTNGTFDVFVHDRQTRITELASSGSGDGGYEPSISGDGRYVAFSWGDILVRDRQTGTTERLTQGGDPSISGAGRYVAFGSGASDLVPGDTNDVGDAFVHDRQSGTTERVSVPSGGTKPAVLLVHGWNLGGGLNGCSGMNAMESWLEGQPGLAGRVECFSVGNLGGYNPACWGADYSASKLGQYVRDFKNRMGVDKIYLVGYSFGGIVSRYYIEERGGAANIQGLVMVGTPNLGFPAVQYFASVPFLTRVTCDGRGQPDRALRDMDNRLGVISALDDEWAGPPLGYRTIAGTADSSMLIGPPLVGTEPENDCLVLVAEVQLAGVTNETVPDRHLADFPCNRVSGTELMQDQNVFTKVLAGLGLATQGTAEAGRALGIQQAGSAQGVQRPFLGAFSGTLSGSGQASHQVSVDSSVGEVIVSLSWVDEENVPGLQLVLRRPGGTIVSEQDPGVDHTVASPSTGDGQILAEEWRVNGPDTGDWTLEVAAGQGSGAAEYAVLALAETDVTLELQAEQVSAPVGSQSQLTAVLNQGKTAVTGATVLAEVARPDGSSDSVDFFDDGLHGDGAADDGVYGNGLLVSQCGIHTISVSADFQLTGEPVHREASDAVTGTVSGDLTGDYCLADDDSDGCTDSAELGPDPGAGGQRDPLDFWDLMSVFAGNPLVRDATVSVADISAVVGRFGANDTGAGQFDRGSDPLSTPKEVIGDSRADYHPSYDRGGTIVGQDVWNLLPPDGAISVGDISAAVNQFGHSCA